MVSQRDGHDWVTNTSTFWVLQRLPLSLNYPKSFKSYFFKQPLHMEVNLGLLFSSGILWTCSNIGYPLQYSDMENPRDYSPGDCKESDISERLSLSSTQDRLKLFYARWPKILKYSTILPNLWTDFQGSWDPWSIFSTGPFKFRAASTYRISYYCLFNYSSFCYYNPIYMCNV